MKKIVGFILVGWLLIEYSAAAQEFQHDQCYYRVLGNNQDPIRVSKKEEPDADFIEVCINRTLEMSAEGGCIHYFHRLGYSLEYYLRNSNLHSGQRLFITCSPDNRFEHVTTYSKKMRANVQNLKGSWSEHVLVKGEISEKNSCTLSIPSLVRNLRSQAKEAFKALDKASPLEIPCAGHTIVLPLNEAFLGYSEFNPDTLGFKFDFDAEEDVSHSEYISEKDYTAFRDHFWSDLKKIHLSAERMKAIGKSTLASLGDYLGKPLPDLRYAPPYDKEEIERITQKMQLQLFCTRLAIRQLKEKSPEEIEAQKPILQYFLRNIVGIFDQNRSKLTEKDSHRCGDAFAIVGKGTGTLVQKVAEANQRVQMHPSSQSAGLAGPSVSRSIRKRKPIQDAEKILDEKDSHSPVGLHSVSQANSAK